jgi:purine-binding chemotaxis protein CheW
MNENFAEKEKFLVYRIQNELYASPLLDFREVIEYTEPKHVPNMAPYFVGMINLRGLIIGVVDLRLKFGYGNPSTTKSSLLICETETGPIGAVIDHVDFVIQIHQEEIQDLKVDGRVKVRFLKGFIHHGESLITVLDVKKLISDFSDFSNPSEAA